MPLLGHESIGFMTVGVGVGHAPGLSTAGATSKNKSKSVGRQMPTSWPCQAMLLRQACGGR